MATITQETRFDLVKSELITLCDAKGHIVSCRSGELWITADGEAQDIILNAGETHHIDSPAVVSISALKTATLEVSRRQDFGPRASGAQRLRVSLLGWEFPPLAAFSSLLIR